jgi:hypothetical protein
MSAHGLPTTDKGDTPGMRQLRTKSNGIFKTASWQLAPPFPFFVVGLSQSASRVWSLSKQKESGAWSPRQKQSGGWWRVALLRSQQKGCCSCLMFSLPPFYPPLAFGRRGI